MTGPYLVRAPEPEEGEKLAALGRTTFIETFAHLYRQEDLQTFLENQYDPDQVTAEITDPELEHRVVEYEEELIGFLKMGPLHLPVDHPLPNAHEIRQLYVLKEHTSKGLGKRLMDWALGYLTIRRRSHIYLSVFSENHRAIRFYENYRFQKCGEYLYPVGGHLDLEWIMVRSLESAPNPKNT